VKFPASGDTDPKLAYPVISFPVIVPLTESAKLAVLDIENFPFELIVPVRGNVGAAYQYLVIIDPLTSVIVKSNERGVVIPGNCGSTALRVPV